MGERKKEGKMKKKKNNNNIKIIIILVCMDRVCLRLNGHLSAIYYSGYFNDAVDI